jgi:2-hydroxychromene-2-carboxylate isomerase
MTTIQFYFDFVSPYAYLASGELAKLAKRQGCTIDYRPINLNAAKLAAGNTAPPTAAMPPKLKYAMADFTRWCARYGVPLDFSREGPPVSEPANKGTFYAIDRGQAAEYVTAMWRATFGSGGLHGKEAVLRAVAGELGWDADDFLAFIASDEASKRYAEANAEAQGKGVFGAPTMIVGEELWWGNDRLDFLEEYLAENCA